MTFALVHPFEGWGTFNQWAVGFFAVIVSWAATAAFKCLALVMRAAQGHGIVAFELAGSVARVIEIFDGWGEEAGRGRRAAVWSLLVDLPFPAAYGVGAALAAAVVAESARGHHWSGAADVAAVVVWSYLVAAAADLFKDAALAVVLAQGWQAPERVRQPAPWMAHPLALVKFGLLAANARVIVVIATVGGLSLLVGAVIRLFGG